MVKLKYREPKAGKYLQKLKMGLTDPKDLKKLIAKLEREKWEEKLRYQIKALKLPGFVKELYWHPKRDYHTEIACPPIMLLVEVDGGTFMKKSGHTTGVGYEHDRIRDAEAFILGYKVLRVTPAMIERGEAINYIEKLFYGN